MNLPRLKISFVKREKPLPPEVVTALSRASAVIEALAQGLGELEKNHKETRQRLETVYRKVYRDIAKEDQDAAAETPKVERPAPRPIKPGDPAY